ncbi:MAG: hypothetical protein F6K58_27755 [Symploca sp. SIO2E9]|nr:hypothetical protein [Symploca sp. SIO2E9]
MKIKRFKQALPIVVVTALMTTSSLVNSPAAFAQKRAALEAGEWIIENARRWFPRRRVGNTLESPRVPRRSPELPAHTQCRIGSRAGRAGYDGPLPRGRVMKVCRDINQRLTH